MIFYLGTHEPAWMPRTSVPLFLSRRRLARRKALPVAAGPWALDSGGFTELNRSGSWMTTPKAYVDEVRSWRDRIGNLLWAVIQDWMCEPLVLAKTGRTVVDHQRLTVASYLDLSRLAPEVPWLPVVQGWRPDDYLRHVEMYRRSGIVLTRLPIVGVGSVCRRQATEEAGRIVRQLAALGLRLHGFGFKVAGIVRHGGHLASADSMAWSFRARRSGPLPGCTHKSCANCLRYALAWRGRLIGRSVIGAN